MRSDSSIVSLAANMCIDDSGATYANGNKIQLYGCSANNVAQQVCSFDLRPPDRSVWQPSTHVLRHPPPTKDTEPKIPNPRYRTQARHSHRSGYKPSSQALGPVGSRRFPSTGTKRSALIPAEPVADPPSTCGNGARPPRVVGALLWVWGGSGMTPASRISPWNRPPPAHLVLTRPRTHLCAASPPTRPSCGPSSRRARPATLSRSRASAAGSAPTSSAPPAPPASSPQPVA